MKVITIGRNKENNDVVVNDNKVSRNHLQIIRDDQGNFSVLDLNSTNGTYVNGQRISGEVPLKVADELEIGDRIDFICDYYTYCHGRAIFQLIR